LDLVGVNVKTGQMLKTKALNQKSCQTAFLAAIAIALAGAGWPSLAQNSKQGVTKVQPAKDPELVLDEELEKGRANMGPDKTQWGWHSLIMQGAVGFADYAQVEPNSKLGFGFDFGALMQQNFWLGVGLSFYPAHETNLGEFQRSSIVSLGAFYRPSQNNLQGLDLGFQFGSHSWGNDQSLTFGPIIQYAYKIEDFALMPIVRGQYWMSSNDVGGAVYSIQVGIRFEKDL
jgi:hypothetical protein